MPRSSMVRPDRPPVALDLAAFLYESIDLSPAVDTGQWPACYDEIAVDPYVADGYRYKAVAWFRVKHAAVLASAAIDEHLAKVNELSGMSRERSRGFSTTSEPSWGSAETGHFCWSLPQYAMQQSSLYNPVHGDMRREYPRMNEAVVESAAFRRLLIHYASYFGWDDAVVLAQFQRVDCSAGRIGRPAVEGFHQDGNPHVAMLIVNRANITRDSGVSQYKLDDHGRMSDELVFDAVIPRGHVIYWNDRRVWHFGTDLTVADEKVNGGRGVRDIVIMSAKQPPANMPMGPVPERFRAW